MSKRNLGITWDSERSEKDVSVLEGFLVGRIYCKSVMGL